MVGTFTDRPSQLPSAVKMMSYGLGRPSGDAAMAPGTRLPLPSGILPPPDDPEDIETSNFLDIYALGNLQRQVNANRTAAGFSRISEYDYRHIQRGTLESAMEELSLGGQSFT